MMKTRTTEEATTYMREWRSKNRDRYNAYQRKYGKNYRNRPNVKEALRKSQNKFHKENPLASRNFMLKHYYGITIQQFNDLLEKQNNVCAICKQPPKRIFHVDHDHDCCKGRNACGKCVRGLLCELCNRGLGQFQDDLEILEGAVAYLKAVKNK
jgi:hypothetical protein